MKACPRCDSEIGDTAVACSCGWRDRKPKGEPIERRTDCGYGGCEHDAIIKLRTKTGWLNVCDQHYRIYHHLTAERHCNELGLDTLQKRLAWLREHGKKIPGLLLPREPGEDREEEAIA